MLVIIKMNSKVYDFSLTLAIVFSYFMVLVSNKIAQLYSQSKLTSKAFFRFQIFVSFHIGSIKDGENRIRQNRYREIPPMLPGL